MSGLSELSLTSTERAALEKACPYFPSSYLDYLASMRLDPVNQVKLTFVPKSEDGQMGEVQCVIEGLWRDCILYEVPIMSISEFYGFVGRLGVRWPGRAVDDFSERGVFQICRYGLDIRWASR